MSDESNGHRRDDAGDAANPDVHGKRPDPKADERRCQELFDRYAELAKAGRLEEADQAWEIYAALKEALLRQEFGRRVN